MPFNDNGKNAMLTNGLGTAITFTSLHTGDPGSTGANEQATTGSPAYARKGVTWGTAAAGKRTNSAAITFDVPASTQMYLGFWSAVTAGTFYGYAPLGPTFVAGIGAVSTGDTVTSHGHGLVNDDRVQVFNVLAESIPTGLNEGTLYFVIGATADTFQLSLTSGGAAVDVTTTGEVVFQKVVPEVFSAQGTLVLSIGALTLDATLV